MKIYSIKNTGALDYLLLVLSIDDLFSAGGRYQTLCWSNFGDSVLIFTSSGRLLPLGKLSAFKIMN